MDKPLDERSIEILADILDQTLDAPEPLNIKRYRVDHTDDLDRIDNLTKHHLLELDRSQTLVHVGHVGLYLTQGATRDGLLTDIDRILGYLGKQYRNTLDEKGVRLADIATSLDMARPRVECCVRYIRESKGLAGTTDLSEPDAEVFPPEAVIHFNSIEAFLANRARQWFPQLFESKPTKDKTHGNAELNAEKREQVLGAAIAVMANFPDQCKRGGSYSGTRIATVIDQKMELWWPNEEEPPLAISTMTKMISQHLKLPK